MAGCIKGGGGGPLEETLSPRHVPASPNEHWMRRRRQQKTKKEQGGGGGRKGRKTRGFHGNSHACCIHRAPPKIRLAMLARPFLCSYVMFLPPPWVPITWFYILTPLILQSFLTFMFPQPIICLVCHGNHSTMDRGTSSGTFSCFLSWTSGQLVCWLPSPQILPNCQVPIAGLLDIKLRKKIIAILGCPTQYD